MSNFSVPFLLAYLKNFYTWWSDASNKKHTFMLPLLNLYPQFGRLDTMIIVKLRQGSGKDMQGMALKAKGLPSLNPCLELTLKFVATLGSL